MVRWWKPVLLLLLTFALAVSLKNDFLVFLLGFEFMVYLAAFVQVHWLCRKVSVRVKLPQTRVLRGETFQIQGELENISRFPIPQLMVRLAVRFFPEKEELLLKGKLMLDSMERGSVCFELDGCHCGCLEIRPDQLVITDFLGVFQRRCPVDSGEKHFLFILPEVLQEGREIPDAQGLFLNEDGDSGKKGNDAMDVSNIRSYRKGDSLKLVHWKLTARLNNLMVREMVDSVEKRTWLYLNLQESPNSPQVRRNPDAWDHFLETVASISSTLLKIEKRHMVIWMDATGNVPQQYDVSDETSLQEMLCGLLRADSYPPRDDSLLLKEISLDETKGTCVEIDLQGNFVRTEKP